MIKLTLCSYRDNDITSQRDVGTVVFSAFYSDIYLARTSLLITMLNAINTSGLLKEFKYENKNIYSKYILPSDRNRLDPFMIMLDCKNGLLDTLKVCKDLQMFFFLGSRATPLLQWTFTEHNERIITKEKEVYAEVKTDF